MNNHNNLWFGRGYVTKSSKYGVTGTGLQYLLFTMRTQEERVRGRPPQSSWHRCIVWGKLAEQIRDYFKEGARINVVGSYCTKRYKKHENDPWTYELQVNVETVDFIGFEHTPEANEAAEAARAAEEEFDADMPL